jgi:hypothetical protein
MGHASSTGSATATTIKSPSSLTWSFAHSCHSLGGLDEGEFTEGHELDRKWKVAKEMVGRRLTQAEAKRLLAKLE